MNDSHPVDDHAAPHTAPVAVSPRTRVVAAGRPERAPGAALNPPVTFTSTYIADGPTNYARVDNPTWTPFEEAVGGLEGGEALLYSSGMAAVSAVLALVPTGGVVVAPAAAYNGVVVLLTEAVAAGRLEVRWVDVTDADAVVEALTGADLLWLESPTNPLLDVADIAGLTLAAHEAGALVAVDNTFATPLLQRPLEDGVDIVVHSATKYLAGHSDVILGLTVTAADEPGRALRERTARHRTLGGAIAGPMEAWLALRGLRTLALRLERSCANAADLAARLADHPRIARVRYPGWGAIVSVDVAGTGDGDGALEAETLASGTRIWSHSTSLGGVESQLERRRRQPGEPETTPVNLVRMSVGVEDVDDLWTDLRQALDAIG
ncbi:trans-sulfuration enzyme family protein [Janibacter sp. GS2]|uniref:trans-sulfuration enzyme family protein n=1 Tax=Janibacter sp. GS2 TaxID=3442646 RepID=UPI003EB867B9